jgi:hypothetical protein
VGHQRHQDDSDVGGGGRLRSDDFFRWARAARDTTPGRNLATKALGYALNQEAELRRVLADGDLPLDNTRAERALRKIVVGCVSVRSSAPEVAGGDTPRRLDGGRASGHAHTAPA